MRRFLILSLVMLCLLIAPVNVYAREESLYDDLGIEDIYDSLSKDAKDSLAAMGVGKAGEGTLSNVSFKSVISEVLRILGEQLSSVIASCCLVLGVMLLYSLIDGFTSSMSQGAIKEVLSVVTALCVACMLVIPVTQLIKTAGEVINASSQVMLTFIPVMLGVLISCGKALSGSGYYALMTGAAQVVAQISSKFIVPMLNVFLGVGICSAVVPELKFTGILNTFSKTLKWVLSFSFTIFSALLTFKTLISTSVDNVSTRAVRYTMSSFVPVVGAALSEAYKTVQGSVNILKNGVGVFVIFAVAAVFLPLVLKLLAWIFSVNILKSVGEIMNLSVPCNMLTGVSTVLSMLLSVILCVAALFIISTALIMTVGGAS
ncbi:MAG: hypothetical protein ACI4HJ_06975 [Ruminococcus sp.]